MRTETPACSRKVAEVYFSDLWLLPKTASTFTPRLWAAARAFGDRGQGERVRLDEDLFPGAIDLRGPANASLEVAAPGIPFPNVLDSQCEWIAWTYPDEVAALTTFDVLISNCNLKASIVTPHVRVFKAFDHSYVLLNILEDPDDSIGPTRQRRPHPPLPPILRACRPAAGKLDGPHGRRRCRLRQGVLLFRPSVSGRKRADAVGPGRYPDPEEKPTQVDQAANTGTIRPVP